MGGAGYPSFYKCPLLIRTTHDMYVCSTSTRYSELTATQVIFHDLKNFFYYVHKIYDLLKI